MPDANDILGAAQGLRQVQEEATGTLSGSGQDLVHGMSGFVDFFRHPENLLALTICLVSLIGLYRLLRAERIIPAYHSQGRGGIFSSALAQRLAMKIIIMVVLAMIGLALFVARMSGLFDNMRHLF